MAVMVAEDFNIYGLSDAEVAKARKSYGDNKLSVKKENRLLQIFYSLFTQPMVILLLVAATIYFLTDNTGDGIFMVLAIMLVSTISLYQESRTNKALKKIQDLTQPTCKVFRNGKQQVINTRELVIGDSFIAEEVD